MEFMTIFLIALVVLAVVFVKMAVASSLKARQKSSNVLVSIMQRLVRA